MLSHRFILAAFVAGSCYGLIQAQTPGPGDLIFTGFSSDDPKGFSFIATDSIPPNTTIYFTDNGWLSPGDSLRLGEGFLSYTTSGSGLLPGQQVAITHSGFGSFYTASDGTNLVHFGNFNLATTGDQITAFTGAVTSSTSYSVGQIITALGYMNQSGFNATASTANHSAVPPGLVIGQDAVALPHADNARFMVPTGYLQLSQLQLQALACTASSWETANDFAFYLPPSTRDTLSGLLQTGSTTGVACISGSAVVDGSLQIGELIIPLGSSLEVPHGTTLSLGGDASVFGSLTGNGTLIFNGPSQRLRAPLSFSGTVIVDSGATLFTNNQLQLLATDSTGVALLGRGIITGGTTTQAFLNLPGGPTDGRYFHLGAPQQGVPFADFNEGGFLAVINGAGGSVWQWNAAQAQWEAPASAGATLEQGRGYAFFAGSINPTTFYLLDDAGTIATTGSVALNQDVAVALQYNDGQTSGQTFAGGTSVQSTEGWNFVANPFPCTYSWNQQSLPNGCNNAIYVHQGSGNYATYINGVGTNGGSEFLAPYQGFWIQTSNSSQPGNLVFAASNRVTNQNTALLKSAAGGLDGIYLDIGDQSVQDQVYLGIDPSATTGFDESLDAWKIPGNEAGPSLSSINANEPFSIDRKPSDSPVFSLAVGHPVDQCPLTLQISSNHLHSFTGIYLKDVFLNHWHNLGNGPYSFVHETAWTNPRFELHFSNTDLNADQQNLEQAAVIPHPEGFVLELNKNNKVNVLVYNVLGQLIMNKFAEQNSTLFRLPAVSQTYIVQLICNGSTATHKLLKQ